MLIVLNGSINAGKTTTAQTLARLLPNTAHIEVDSLREFIAWMPLEESIPINLENAVAVARVFLKYGLHVVLSYPLRAADYEWLRQQFDCPIHFFTLRPPLATSQSQRGTRVLSEWEIARIAYHYTTAGANPDLGIVIDNSQMSAEVTAREIIRQTQEAEAR
jgi:hypothetical protein